MRILLAIDESECSASATNAVIAQFAPHNAEVHVLNVDEWPKGLPTSIAFAEGSTAANSILGLHDLRRHNAASLVEGAAQQLRTARFTTTTSVREGDARRAILDCASEWHADLIVLGVPRQERPRPADPRQRVGQRRAARAVFGRNRPRRDERVTWASKS